jgi:hypothetical protein
MRCAVSILPSLASLCLGLALATTASAQPKATPAPTAGAPPLEIRLDGTPSGFVDAAGQVSACGLRVFGIESLPPPSDRHRTVDISILLGQETLTRGVGLVKASSMETTTSALKANQPMRPLRVTDGWLRVPGSARTTPRDGPPLADSDDPNVLRYLADASVLFAVTDAALEGKPIEVSVVRADLAAHPVYRGVPTLDAKARQQFVTCMRALQARVATRR